MDLLPSHLACYLCHLDTCTLVSGIAEEEYFLGVYWYDIQELMLYFHPSFEYSDPQVQILDREKTGLSPIGMVANDYTHKPIKKNVAKCWFTHLIARLPEKQGTERWHGYSKGPFWHIPNVLY